MKNILKKLSGGADIFLGLIGFVGILVITANAFCRFVLKVPMSWSDESFAPSWFTVISLALP